MSEPGTLTGTMTPVDDPGRLTSEDILRLMQVPGWPRLFVLSPFEQPVNVMSQQLRAINLVHAVLDTEILLPPAKAERAGRAPRARLGVVGGGVAGTTAAAYAALRGCTVQVFERNNAPLRLFANSDRFLDPVLYDWPEITRGQRAAIPVMSWTGAPGKDVTKHLEEQWKGWQQLHDIAFWPSALVTLPEQPLSSLDDALEITVRDAHNTVGRRLELDAVILAVGFGPETPPKNPDLKLLTQRFQYWDREKNPVWLRPKERTALISGTGDGGLTDLFWLAIHDFDERMLWKVVETLTEEGRIAEQVSRIEREIRLSVNSGLTDVSRLVTSKYMAIETPRLDALLRGMLREVDITLNGTEAEPLTDKSYPINRFLASRLFRLARAQLDGSKKFSLRYLRGRLECWKTDEGVFAYDTERAVPVNEARPFSTAIIRRGPSHVLAESFPAIYQRCKEVQHRTRLGFARRAVWPAPYVAQPSGGDPARNPLRGVVRRHVFYSDLFDSTVQRALQDRMESVVGGGAADETFRTLYLGRLRLGLLMHDTILLTDTQVLDGAFFLTLSRDEIRTLVPRTILKLRKGSVAASTLAMITNEDGTVRPFEISAIRDAAVRGKVRDLMRARAGQRLLPSAVSGVEQILALTQDLALDGATMEPLIGGWQMWHAILTEMGAQPVPWSKVPLDFDQQVVDPGRLFAELPAGKNLFELVYKQRKSNRTMIYTLLSDWLAADGGGGEDAWKIRSFYNAAYNAGIARKEGANVIETLWVDGARAFGVEYEHDQAERSAMGGLVAMLGAIDARRFDEIEEASRRKAFAWRRGLAPFEDLVEAIRTALGDAPAPSATRIGPRADPSWGTREQRRWTEIAAGLLAKDAFLGSFFVPPNLDKGDTSPRFVTGQWSEARSPDPAEPRSPLSVTYYDRSLWRAPEDADLSPDWSPAHVAPGRADTATKGHP